MLKSVQFGGCSFAYLVRGSGEPVVLIQGVGLHGNGWLPQTDALCSSFRCISFDNRGMGNSQPSAVPITVEQMAADTLAIMDAEAIPAAHLVGHSLGGVIAQQIALTYPDRVTSLSLICTSARGADATRFSPMILMLGLRSRVGPRHMRRRAFLRIVSSRQYLSTQDPEALAERYAHFFGHDLADSPPITLPQLRALKRFDAGSRLDKLAAIPTLVISAEQDLIFPPRCGRALAAAIHGARYMEIADAAHGVTLECPHRVNTLLLDHLRTASLRSKH